MQEIIELIDSDQQPFNPDWYEISDKHHFWFVWRFRSLCRFLLSPGMPGNWSELRVLDVGGGTGVLAEQIEDRFRCKVDIAELDRNALVQAGNQGNRYFYDVCHRHLELLDSYDVVIVFDVIEHLQEPGSFLAACRDHLKPGGLLLVNVPALQRYYSRYDRAVGHLRRYDTGTLGALCRDYVTDTRMQYWGTLLLPVLWLRKLLIDRRDPGDPSAIVRAGFKPPAPLLNRCLVSMQWLDALLSGLIPIGTSLLLAGRRPHE